jgi:hypothetical protein
MQRGYLIASFLPRRLASKLSYPHHIQGHQDQCSSYIRTQWQWYWYCTDQVTLQNLPAIYIGQKLFMMVWTKKGDQYLIKSNISESCQCYFTEGRK